MINKTSHYAYFTLSFNHIIRNSFLSITFLFLEYYIVMIHLIEGITLSLLNSYEGNFVNDFYMNNLSIFFHFRKLKYSFSTGSGPVYHWSFIIVLMLLKTFYFVYYYYLSKRVANKIFHSIIINFYDYFYFRVLGIFIFDIYINYLIKLAFNNSSTSISSDVIFIAIILIVLLIYLYTFMKNFLLFFVFLSLKENSNYPFDYISKQFDMVLLFMKIILCFQNNIYQIQLEINYLTRSCMMLLLSSLILQAFYLVYYFIKMPSLFLMNYNLHKLRAFILMTTILWSIVNLFQGYYYKTLYYIVGIAATVLCFSVLIAFNDKSLLIKFVLCNMSPFNQQLMLFELNNCDLLNKKVYKEKIAFHLRNCDRCNFCYYYKKNGYDTPKDDSNNYRTDYFFNCFLEAYIDNEHKNKSYFHLVYEDLFKVLSRTLDSTGVISFQFRYCFQILIKKYLSRNEIPITMNLMLIYHNLFENQTQENISMVNMIKIYIVLVHKIKKIISHISSYIVDDNKSPRKFLELGTDIHSLQKNIKMEFILNRKNSGDYCVNLIIFIYEEITNIPINKEKGMIKDEILSFEDMLNAQFGYNKNIIILFDPYKKISSIKKAGMDMFHFVGTDLTSLFPKELRYEGEKRFYESLNHSNPIKDFEFIIQTHKNKYAIFRMQFALLYENLNADLYINGEYCLSNDDVILTRYQKDIGDHSEVIIGNISDLFNKNEKDKEKDKDKVVNDEDSHGLTLLKKEKTKEHTLVMLNGVKVPLRLKYTIENEYYCYNVYISSKYDKKTSNIQTNSINSVFDNGQFGRSNIYRIDDVGSYCNSGSSVLSVQSHSVKEQTQISLNIEKKYKKYQARFIKTTYITLVFCIIIIIFSIISLVIELNRNCILLDSYKVYTQLRAVNRLFYNTITSILSVVCIGKPNSSSCVNYYYEYAIKYNRENNIEYPQLNYSKYENHLKVVDLGKKLILLKSLMYTLDDPKATQIFYHGFEYSYLSIIDDSIKIISENTTFVNALEILLNGLMVIMTSDKYTTYPVYIISLNDYDFSNIHNKRQLEEWQVEYYNLVINFQKYLNNWVDIQISLSDNTNGKLNQLSNLVIICLNISNIFHVLLFSLLFYFIYSFTNLFIFNMNKLMLKLNKETFNTFLIQKYAQLSVLSNFFEENPVHLIKEIGQLYINHKKTTKKPPSPNPHKDTKVTNTPQMVNYFPFKDYFEIVAKFYHIIFAILIYYFIIFIFFLLIWCINKEKILLVFNIITENTVSSCSGYNIFSLVQIMILVNQTQSDISVNMHYEQNNFIEYEAMRALESIVRLEVQRKEVSNLMKTTNDFLDLDCDTFFDEIKDTFFNAINEEHPEEKFKENYPAFCKTFSIMAYKNDIVFYKTIFYEIHKIVNYITNFTYDDLTNYLIEGDIFYLSDLEFLLYRPFRTWFNNVVYSAAIENSINLEKSILFSILGITIASEVIIFVLLYVEIFRRLKKINGILIGVKNVFKISK